MLVRAENIAQKVIFAAIANKRDSQGGKLVASCKNVTTNAFDA